MAPRPPLWRRVFDTVERPVGDALSAGARSGAFADVVALIVRLQRRLQREVERQSRRALHGANLPTASDMRRLSKQITDLERQVRDLSGQVDEEKRRRPGPASGPGSRRGDSRGGRTRA